MRFASTQPEGEWRWSIHTAKPHHDFKPADGTLTAGPPIQDHPHRAVARGFVTAHPSGRSFCYADGSPAFWVFDTAWAMPFRATLEDVSVYAADRQAKGFNAALMSVQPDMNARGPVGRNVDEGFEVGFHDLSEGRLIKINVAYFQYLDKIIDVLIDYGITPAPAGLPRIRLERARRGRPGRVTCRLRALLPIPGGAFRRPPCHLPALW